MTRWAPVDRAWSLTDWKQGVPQSESTSRGGRQEKCLLYIYDFETSMYAFVVHLLITSNYW